MNLDALYDERSVSDKIKTEKNIMLVIPDKDTDTEWFFEQSGLDPFEVAITYPKDGVRLIEEIAACKPRLVVQIGDAPVTKRYPFIPHMSISPDMQERIDNADWEPSSSSSSS
jgi:hypothetical protein